MLESDVWKNKLGGVFFGRQAIVGNGYLRETTIQTVIGDVTVKVPKVRGISRSGVHFQSYLLPPYLRGTKSIEDLIPWLYLKGLSTGDYSEALGSFFVMGTCAMGKS